MTFKRQIQAQQDEIIATTQRLIQFNTVESEALPNAPFGQGNRDALDYVLQLGAKWGFAVTDLDGYSGYLEFGDGQEVVAIIPHLDVVPEGDGWDYPPFDGELAAGRIYGRGAADNKGPAIAALYAFKLVRDSGLPVNKRVRLIFGCDEESGFECVKHYIKVEGLPTAGFTPDGSFPVINAEKGIIKGTFTAALPADVPKLYFTGGTAGNVVPHYAKAIIGDTIYEATGIAAHASTPELGDNAIIKLARQLQTIISHPVLEFLKIASDPETLGIAVADEISGPLTYNLGIIDVDENNAKLSINIRYPVTGNAAEIISQLKQAGKAYGFSFEDYTDSPAHYVPEDTALVKDLLQVYHQVTGLEGKPLSMGGGTYARVLGNFVAFGARFPQESSTAHQKNEFITVDTLLQATEIYANAIYQLAKERS